MLSDLPEVGETYLYFDDGKVKESRQYQVDIEKIIPFDEADQETLSNWREEVEACHWIYNTETDYFICAKLELEDDDNEKIIFVRTLDNGWFSLGFWAGILDVDGSLKESTTHYD